MSNDEWIATEFELNEMLFVPAGDGAVPLSNSRRTTPILTAKWGPQSRLRPARRRRRGLHAARQWRGRFRHPIRWR
jgi:hypothetical protein